MSTATALPSEHASIRAGERWIIPAILAVCLLPILAGLGLYHSGWRPAKGANTQGTLLEPPRLLVTEGLRQADGSPLAAGLFREKWTVLLALPAICDSQCDKQAETRLVDMRHIQVSLNKEMGRLRRVAVSAGPQDAIGKVGAEQKDLIPLRAEAGWLANHAATATPVLYVLDPQGQAVLRYDAEAKPQGIRRDLERLLKFSWIG